MSKPLWAAVCTTAGLALIAAVAPLSYARGASETGKLLGGYVQVVAYANGQIRICPDYAIALDLGPAPPPNCSDGLRATGIQTDALPNHASSPAERWGSLYLVGRYHNDGTFSVSSQSPQAPTGSNPSGSNLATPPCRRPRGGWRLVTPTLAQQNAIPTYKRRYPRDITSVAMFHDATIPTIASTHPRRTRTALARAWPRQLCVVRSRYSLKVIWHTRRRLVKVLTSGPKAARYGWISGAGGISCTGRGQPTTPLEVLIETPALRALLRRQPRGLVVLDATIHPVAAS